MKEDKSAIVSVSDNQNNQEHDCQATNTAGRHPLVSIVIPLYNKENQIKRTIDSVINQEFGDFEVVVVNDGSTDNSLQIVEKYEDERIRIISQRNTGVSAARNRGINEAKGSYVLLLDADDCLLSDALSLACECEQADIIVGSFNQLNDEGVIKRKIRNSLTGIIENPYKEYCKKRINLRIGNFYIKRHFLEKKGGLRTDLTLYEDEEWILRIIDGAIVFSSQRVILEYIRIEGGLSFGFKPIEKEWAGIATVKLVGNKYKKRILGDFIFRRFVIRLKQKDRQGIKVIWENNSWSLLYCMCSFVDRAFRGGFICNYLKDRIK